jgi:hypothetical protein
MPKSEPLNEVEIKRAAELREWLETRMSELETEMNRLRDMQQMVDSVLRRGSFIPAAELKSPQVRTVTAEKKEGQTEESRQLRRTKDGLLTATAFITHDKLVVIPSSDVKVSQNTPPFQTFFINRILKGYESKDKELASAGKLEKTGVLSYQVEEKDGLISKVTIENYRDKARLNEILSTVNWAFTRMLEKK